MADPLETLRLIVGLLFVLIAPGLAWSFVFFERIRALDAPKETPGIDWIERSALSFGLSIAIVPASVFLLNYFLRVPITTLNAVLLVLVLTLAPVLYMFATKKWQWPRRGRPDADAGDAADST